MVRPASSEHGFAGGNARCKSKTDISLALESALQFRSLAPKEGSRAAKNCQACQSHLQHIWFSKRLQVLTCVLSWQWTATIFYFRSLLLVVMLRPTQEVATMCRCHPHLPTTVGFSRFCNMMSRLSSIFFPLASPTESTAVSNLLDGLKLASPYILVLAGVSKNQDNVYTCSAQVLN